MSVTSKLVGEVTNGTPRDYLILNGEHFYAIEVQFLDAPIDVLVSEYVKQDVYSGKVEVTGYLASTPSKEGHPTFYFLANSIESVPEDTPITNKVGFKYKVTKVSKFKANSRGIDLLPLVVADYTPHQTTSVIYMCLRGALARKHKDRGANYYISGEGYLKKYRDIYEIIVMDAEVK